MAQIGGQPQPHGEDAHVADMLCEFAEETQARDDSIQEGESRAKEVAGETVQASSEGNGEDCPFRYVPPDGTKESEIFNSMLGEYCPEGGASPEEMPAYLEGVVEEKNYQTPWMQGTPGDSRLRALSSGEEAHIQEKFSISDEQMGFFCFDRKEGTVIDMRTMAVVPYLDCSFDPTLLFSVALLLEQHQEVIASIEASLKGPDEIEFQSSFENLLPNFYEALPIASLLVLVNSKSSDRTAESIKNSVKSIEDNGKSLQALHQKNLEKMKAAMEKKVTQSPVLSWLYKFFMFIVCVVIVVLAVCASVATANPLAIVGAIAAVGALVNSVLDIAGTAAGTDVTLGAGFQKLAGVVSNLCVQLGASKETADNLGKVVSGCLGLTTGAFLADPGILSMCFEGIAMACGVPESTAKIVAAVLAIVFMVVVVVATAGASMGQASSTLASFPKLLKLAGSTANLEKVSRVVQSSITTANSAAQIAQSSCNIQVSKAQFDRDQLLAEAQKVKSLLGSVRDEQKLGQTEVQRLVKVLNSMRELCNDSIKSAMQAAGSAFRQQA